MNKPYRNHRAGTCALALTGLLYIFSARLAAQTFDPPTNIPISCGTTPCEPNDIVIADFNRDSKMDLAITNYRANRVAIFLGNGNGAFRTPVFYDVGPQPSAIAGADLNGDGVTDLVVTNGGSDYISILIAVGDGSFEPAVSYTTAVSPHALTIGDFNNDGAPDLAVASDRPDPSPDMLSILFNNGDGTFFLANSIPGGRHPHAVASGYLDEDDNVDLIVANLTDGVLNVHLGNGDGTFRPGASIPVGKGTFPHHVLAVDLNRDGALDLVTADSLSNTVSVFLGGGDGTFSLVDHYAVGGGPLHVEAADFDGDTFLDLAVANSGTNNISILRGVGDGTFQPAVPATHPAAARTTSLATGDLNGDGKPDVAAVNVDASSVTLLLSR